MKQHEWLAIFRAISAAVIALSSLTAKSASLGASEPPGPWEGFPRSQPNSRYEDDVGAKPDYSFGVTKAFKPYVDPDRSEVEDLPDPLRNAEFQSYNLIVIVSTQNDSFWGPGQTLRIYKRGEGLLYYWLISSGAKGHETSKGYFRPLMFSSRHWSGKYDAPMLWAVFFNGGMALHSSLDQLSLHELGRAAASHGCVHVEDYRSEELFHLVGHSGFGSVDVIDRHSGRRTGGRTSSYKTLIIVAPTAKWGRTSSKSSGASAKKIEATPKTLEKAKISGKKAANEPRSPHPEKRHASPKASTIKPERKPNPRREKGH